MKKMLIVFIAMFFPTFVNAATCEASDKADLLTKASVVAVNYEEMYGFYTGEEVGYPETLDESEYDDYIMEYNYFNINIMNITEDIYIEITNNVDNNKLIVDSADSTNGVYTFTHQMLSNVTTYTIKIYSNGNSGCEDELLTVLYLVVPKYNNYSILSMCEEYPDESVCQKYTTTDTYTESFVISTLSNISLESDILDETTGDSTVEVMDYIVYILIGGISIIGIITIISIVIKRKRSDLK